MLQIALYSITQPAFIGFSDNGLLIVLKNAVGESI
jgi:hypothetical protein